MKRNTLNFWIDLISFLVMFGLTWTGLLIHYVLPPGTGGRHGEQSLALWGLGRHDYGDIHFYLALTLMGLMVIHVWLHWSWICAVMNKLLGMKSTSSARRATYGIVSLVLIVTLTCGGQFWAKSQVTDATKAVERNMIGHQSPSSIHISGQTTLAQAAEVRGIRLKELILQLQLPADVDVDKRLGRLKRQYGFEIDDVRGIVAKNK